MGDKITIDGNIQNSILNIKSTLTNVQQSVGSIPTGDEAARKELQALIEQLGQALEKVPETQKEQAEAVAVSAQTLVETAKAEKPNKTLLQISSEGLKKAAETLADVAPAVVGIAGQVAALVMRMKGLA
jgi:hypothetical protein